MLESDLGTLARARILRQAASGSRHRHAMDRTERFYRIDRLLAAGKPVAMRRFLDELEVSRATFKRDIEYLRDRFNAPIEWNREYGG